MAIESRGDTDEWEYEYDESQREVFLVDLDLTTINRNIKATTANRNKRLVDIHDRTPAKRRKATATTKKAANTSNQDGRAQDLNAEEADIQNDDASGALVSVAPGETGNSNSGLEGLQVLDLHTRNPIVSYGGQVFTCAWTDIIGTTMFFSQPQESLHHDPEMSTTEFDMIGMSRIKLVGTTAKVTPIAQQAKEAGGDAAERPGQSLGTIRRTNAYLNAGLRKQATFLEQLMNIKKNRGEKDNVNVAMNTKISRAVASGKLKHNIQRQHREIDDLNRRAVRGDAEALRKLQQIYIGQGAEDSPDELAEEANGPATRPRRHQRRRQVIESDAEFEVEAAIPPNPLPVINPFPEAGGTPKSYPGLDMAPESSPEANK